MIAKGAKGTNGDYAASQCNDDGVNLDEDLRRRWTATLPGADDLGKELLRRWSEPHRVHHGTRHLLDVLESIDALGGLADDPSTVRLAAWFHDAVYEVGDNAKDNEERSAQLAEQLLRGRVDNPAAVARLVRSTAGHDPEAGDHDAEVLCDADLAILGATPERYATYAEGVSREYAAVPDTRFGPARAQVLRALLDRSRLYRTEPAHQRWERAARVNVAHEVSRLPT